MRYKSTHPRKVRGKPVHQALDEKWREMESIEQLGDIPLEVMQQILDKRFVTANGRVVRGGEINKVKTRFMAVHPQILRVAIEATYLVPRDESFVETGEVRLKEMILQKFCRDCYTTTFHKVIGVTNSKNGRRHEENICIKCSEARIFQAAMPKRK